MGGTRKRKAFRVAATLSSVAVLPLLEFGLRWGGFSYPPSDRPVWIWNPAHDQEMNLGVGMFASAPRQLWVPRPGAKVDWGEDERINAAGYRGPLRRPGRADGCLRVVVLGESCVFGFGVGYPDTFSCRLEGCLRERGLPAEVIDAGVIGYTVRQGLERYRAFARAYEPDVVVAAFGEVNEHFDAGAMTDAEKIESKLPPGSVWTEIARLARVHLRTVHLAARITDRLRGGRDRERGLQFRRNAREQELRERMGGIEWEGRRRVPLEDFDRTIRTLAREVRAEGASFVFLALPRGRATEDKAPVLALYAQTIAAVARDEQIPLADGPAAYAEAEAGGAAEEDLLLDLWHPSREGHRLLAECLARAIAGLPSRR